MWLIFPHNFNNLFVINGPPGGVAPSAGGALGLAWKPGSSSSTMMKQSGSVGRSRTGTSYPWTRPQERPLWVTAMPMAGPDGTVLRGGPADVPAAALLARPRPSVVVRLIALVPVPLVVPVPGVAALAGPTAASARRSRREGVATQALPLALAPPCLGEGGGAGRGEPYACPCPCRPGPAARR